MGIVGTILLLFLLCILIVTFGNFVSFIIGLRKGNLKGKEAAIWIWGCITIVVAFVLIENFSEELDIKVTCPNEAPNCDD